MTITLDVTDRFDFGSPEYRALFARSTVTAFQHWDWLEPFYEHIAPEHKAEQLIVLGRDPQGELQLVVPLVKRFNGSEIVVEYAFLGVTDYAGPVIATDLTSELQADGSLPERFRSILGPFDRLEIGQVRQDMLPLWRLLLGSEAEAEPMHLGSHAVRLGNPYADWRRTNLGSRAASAFARKARRLTRSTEPRLEVVRASDVRAVLEETKRFRHGRFEGDPIQEPHGLAFYTAVAERGAASGLARTFRLVDGDRTVAVVFGLVHGDRYCYVLLGCDYAEYGRHSPGRVILDLAMAEWAAQGGEIFDFTIGDEPFKADFGCVRESMHRFRIPGAEGSSSSPRAWT